MLFIEIRSFIVVRNDFIYFKCIENLHVECHFYLSDLKPENILLKQQGRSGIKGKLICSVHI